MSYNINQTLKNKKKLFSKRISAVNSYFMSYIIIGYDVVVH